MTSELVKNAKRMVFESSLICCCLVKKIEEGGKICSSLSQYVEGLTEDMSSSDEEETQQPAANAFKFETIIINFVNTSCASRFNKNKN